jgi:hypothetical protein
VYLTQILTVILLTISKDLQVQAQTAVARYEGVNVALEHVVAERDRALAQFTDSTRVCTELGVRLYFHFSFLPNTAQGNATGS